MLSVSPRKPFPPENRSPPENRFRPPYNLLWDFTLHDHAKELQGFGILVRVQSSTRRFQLPPKF